MKGLYLMAKEKHSEWVKESKEENKIPLYKQLYERIEPSWDSPGMMKDEISSFRMKTMKDCIRFIETVEANKQGTSEERHLSTFDKYKLGAKFMRMVKQPDDFKYLERFAPDNNDSKIKLKLPENDMKEYQDLK